MKKINLKYLVIFCMSFLFFMVSNLDVSYALTPNDYDISSGYAKESIKTLFEKGILNGDEHGNFNPNGLTTRYQLAKVIVETLKIDTSSIPDKPTFKDVPQNHWAYKYIEAALREGIVKGVGASKFSGDSLVTREQMSTMIVNALGLSREEFEKIVNINKGRYKKLGFVDEEKISAWAEKEIRFAYMYKLIKGKDGAVLDPKGNATREQMAVIVDRFINSKDKILDLKDEANSTQMTALEGDTLVFTFTQPTAGAYIEQIIDSKGNDVTSSLRNGMHTFVDWTRDYKRSEILIRKLEPGETYTIRYSFRFRSDDIRDIRGYNEQKITIPKDNLVVESVRFLNGSQFGVTLGKYATEESAKNINNYSIRDEEGNEISIKNIQVLPGGHDYVKINLDKPIQKKTRVNFTVRNIMSLGYESKAFLPYSINMDVEDKTKPEIKDYIRSTKDDKNYTSITIKFTEPVYSGTIEIDGKPVAKVYGESITIDNLQLDGTKFHNVIIKDLSDGINVNKSIQGSLVRFLKPPKKEYIPPEIVDISYTKDSNGRVENIILTFNEEIKENAGYGASEISAFDGNGTQITGKYNRFCYTSKEVFSGDKHVTFPVAEGIEIYSGDYTIKVDEGLVSDKELNANASFTKTIKILP